MIFGEDAAHPRGEAESAAGAEESVPTPAASGPRVGLVLGAGAARGWAHLGVIEALQEMGVRPAVVVGCSSGAVVGAAYAAGRLPELRAFAEALTWRGMLGYFDFSWRGGGLIEGRWLTDFFRNTLGDREISELPVKYGAVATELSTGRETWFTSGSLADALRASIALPGLVTPIEIEGRWMMDGAMSNPVPVSLCRALGAEIILGVSMSGDLVTLGRTPLALPAQADPGPAVSESPATPEEAAAQGSWLAWFTGAGGGGGWSSYWAGSSAADRPGARLQAPPARPKGRPGYFDVIGQSIFATQNFVTRVRLAADPVDILIAPELEGIGIMDFHRGAEAIAAGREAVRARRAEIAALCRIAGPRPEAAPSLPAAISLERGGSGEAATPGKDAGAAKGLAGSAQAAAAMAPRSGAVEPARPPKAGARGGGRKKKKAPPG